MNQLYDACIIGSGAAGSVVASFLVGKGLDVIVLEQGRWVDASTSYQDLIKNAEPAFAEDAEGRHVGGYAWTTSNVGGGTVFYGGVCWRFREVDFDCSKYMQGEDLDVCWPYGYATLAPYYDIIEKEIGVARSSGCDPSEPPMTNVALPPHHYSPKGLLIAHAARSLGLHPFPTPLSINSVSYGGRKACTGGRICIENFCESGARADATNIYLRPLISAKNFTLRTTTKAVSLTEEKAGHISNVQCLDWETGQALNVKARLFVVACNAIQSAILLLRSTSRFSPSGLGNAFDLVGRGLCYKNSVYMVGKSSLGPLETATPELDHGPCSTVSITDYYIDPSITSGLGGLIYEMSPGSTSVPPSWGPDWFRIECLIGDRPSYRNRVYLSEQRNKFGLQIPVLHYETSAPDRLRLQDLVERGKLLFQQLRITETILEQSFFEQGSGHLHGTCRAGNNPQTSVLDENCRVHDFQNLYVVDGSFMPFPGGLNPTLTIQANARRVAEHLAAQLTQCNPLSG